MGVQDKPKVVEMPAPSSDNQGEVPRIVFNSNLEQEEENRRMDALRIEMEANQDFQIWISSATNYEGIRNVGHARQMLHQVERR